MYRGVIQHRLFVTSFLRQQIEERELEAPIACGRIWRITDRTYEPAPRLSERSWTEVTELLGSEDGWWRGMAQHTIVEEGEDDADAIELTRRAAGSANPLARLHGLWALEGLGALSPQRILAAFEDVDARVRRAAMRLCEPHLGRETDGWIRHVLAAARQGGVRERWQAALTLGEIPGPDGQRALLQVLLIEPESDAPEHGDGFDDRVLVDAVLSGVAGEELELLEVALDGPTLAAESAGRARFVSRLARCIGREERGDRLLRTLALASGLANEPERVWIARAVVQGLLDARPPGPDGQPAPLSLAVRSDIAQALSEHPNEALAQLAAELHGSLLWPGRDDLDLPVVHPLDTAERARFEHGRELYASICASCHHASGRGEVGKAPALRGSEWVLGDGQRLARIVRHGLTGPLTVRGEAWDGEMPAWASTDEDLAAVLTYVRREWGNGAEPVDVETVRRAMANTPSRSGPFTVRELASIDESR